MAQEALSVTLLTRVIQETLEQGFPFVRVIGEVSNYKHHSSGHRYFTLKDDGAQLRTVMWKTRPLDIKPFDGMKVIATGRITLYPSQGNYQLDCFSLVPAGVGDLYIAFEKLKAELQALGYFDSTHKKVLPRMPMRVGVATSPTGAAVRDILSTMAQRMPACEVVFRPTLVQGEGSAADIAKAIRQLDEEDCELIIVGRGGGSIEDLWSFNTRVVADAIYKAKTPIISAVGHETDICIADFVADSRAATPTAAAVQATPVRAEELLYELDMAQDRIKQGVYDLLESKRSMVEAWLDDSMQTIVQEHLSDTVAELEQKSQLLGRLLNHRIQLLQTATEGIARSIRVLQPLAPLQRGFALLRQGDNVIGASTEIIEGQHFEVVRARQSVAVVAQDVRPIDSL